MRIILQRSKRASVVVDGCEIAAIQEGLVVLVGFTDGDDEKIIDYMVDKVIHLRIFDDTEGVMNWSLLDVGGSILSVSQFTLYADVKKGRRPSYVRALNGGKARGLYDLFNEKLRVNGVRVACGKFGADMQVELINDGPVTIMLEKERMEDE